MIEDSDGEHIESCWGHYGLEWAKQAAIDAVPIEPALVNGIGEDEAMEASLA